MSSPVPGPSGGGPAMTPNPGNSGSGIMQCTFNPDEFTSVSIHTAKCAKCDQRNMATMRRCPGCTYQICQPCFDVLNAAGKRLDHGNPAGGRLSGLPATPTRRRVANRADSATPLAGGGSATTASGAVTQAGGMTGRRVTPAKRAASKRKGKGKGKGKGKATAGSDSEPESEDNTSTPAKDTPTPSKRQKTTGDAKDAGEGSEQKKATPARSSVREMQRAEDQVSTGGEQVQTNTDTAASIISRQEPKNETIQELLEKAGVDTPGNRYDEHLMSRRMPTLYTPAFPAASSSRAYGPSPAMAAESPKGKGKAEAVGGRPPSHREASANLTVRQYLANASVAQVQMRKLNLDEDDLDILRGALKESARPLLTEWNKDIASGTGNIVTISLASRMGDLTEAQVFELYAVIQKTSDRKIEEILAQKDVPAKKEQQAGVTLSNMPQGSSPPVGLFQVSPTRPASGFALPSPSPQQTALPHIQLSESKGHGVYQTGKQRANSADEDRQDPALETTKP